MAETLGGVLYGGTPKPVALESEWVALVVAVGAGNQAALVALYDRAHRPVFTIVLRITGNRETAEEVTLDVFHEIWRRAAAYDPANGTVMGWIMNQARSRALDRLRFEHRQKRVDPRSADSFLPEEAPDPAELLEARRQGSALRDAIATLSPAERQVVQAAFFWGLTHSEVAARLAEPLGTVKTRIRLAMQKLRQRLAFLREEGP